MFLIMFTVSQLSYSSVIIHGKSYRHAARRYIVNKVFGTRVSLESGL